MLRGSFLAVAGLSWPTLPRRSLFNFVALLLLFTPSLVFAQQPTDAPAMPDSGWLVALAQKEPWITTVIALMGALRLLLKPIFAALHAFAFSSGNIQVEAMALRIEASRGLRILAFLLDWFGSVKLVPPVKVVISDQSGAVISNQQSAVVSSPISKTPTP